MTLSITTMICFTGGKNNGNTFPLESKNQLGGRPARSRPARGSCDQGWGKRQGPESKTEKGQKPFPLQQAALLVALSAHS